MNRRRWARAGAAVLIVAALALLTWGRLEWWANAILALLAIGLGFVLIRLDRGLQRDEFDTILIKTVNHHRHDWMNDLQLMFGYIGLRKYDILPTYVDKIRAKVMNESAVSKLGVPSLIAYLLTFRTGKRKLALELELDREISLPALPIDLDGTARLIRETIERFDRYAEDGEGEANVLSLQLDVEDEEQLLLLDFVYEGSYSRDMQTAHEDWARRADRRLAIESDWEERRVAMTVRIPFRHSA